MLAASARNVHASGRIGADSNATAGGSSWPVGTFPRPAFLAGKRPFREEEWRASSRRPWPRSATSGVPRKWGMTYELAVRPGAEQHNGVGSQGARVSFMTSCATPFTPSNAHGRQMICERSRCPCDRRHIRAYHPAWRHADAACSSSTAPITTSPP